MNDLVSIIVPTFNRANLIEATIASLLQQTYAAIEIIVVDDHSNDNTAAVIENLSSQDKRIQFHHRPASKPKGANACRNFGLELAKGTFVKWIDSDDLLSPNAIQVQLDKITVAAADLCICNTSIFSDEHQLTPFKNWGNIDQSATSVGFIVDGLRFHTCSGLWRKAHFKNSQPWDESQMNSQEWLMHFQQLCLGVNIVKCQDYLCFARVHSNNMSNRINKRGLYYYNECTARIKAIKFAKSHHIVSGKLYQKITKQLYWYFLFVIYKGAPLQALKLTPSLLAVFGNLFLFPQSSLSQK